MVFQVNFPSFPYEKIEPSPIFADIPKDSSFLVYILYINSESFDHFIQSG
jgi:hypothetical protein